MARDSSRARSRAATFWVYCENPLTSCETRLVSTRRFVLTSPTGGTSMAFWSRVSTASGYRVFPRARHSRWPASMNSGIDRCRASMALISNSSSSATCPNCLDNAPEFPPLAVESIEPHGGHLREYRCGDEADVDPNLLLELDCPASSIRHCSDSSGYNKIHRNSYSKRIELLWSSYSLLALHTLCLTV